MVNTFMKRHIALFWLIIVAVVVLCTIMFLMAKIGRRDRSTNFGRIMQQPNRDRSLRMAESRGWLIRNVDPHRCTVPDDKCQEIKAVFDKMAVAYESGQTNVVRSLFAEMPGCVSNVSSFAYPELLGDFYRQVRKRFLALEEPLEFDSSEKFRTYLDSSMLAVEILGDLDLHHQRYLIVPRIDSQVVRQLKRYKAKFESEQKPEMALYADQRLRAWCEKIDSPDGYIHHYLIFQVSLQLVGDVDWIWEELLGSIRHEADALVSAGYKPKWLDEEFPQSAEWERKRAVEWERRRWGGRPPRKIPERLDKEFPAAPAPQN